MWIGSCDPNHEQLTTSAKETNLPSLIIEDAVTHLERTKAIRYRQYTSLTADATPTSKPRTGCGITPVNSVGSKTVVRSGFHRAAIRARSAVPLPNLVFYGATLPALDPLNPEEPQQSPPAHRRPAAVTPCESASPDPLRQGRIVAGRHPDSGIVGISSSHRLPPGRETQP